MVRTCEQSWWNIQSPDHAINGLVTTSVPFQKKEAAYFSRAGLRSRSVPHRQVYPRFVRNQHLQLVMAELLT